MWPEADLAIISSNFGTGGTEGKLERADWGTPSRREPASTGRFSRFWRPLRTWPILAGVSKDEAEAEAGRLNSEHPERNTYRWLSREIDGDWIVARVKLPPGVNPKPLKPTIAVEDRPPQPDDPRTQHARDTGGLYGGG